MDGLTNEDLLGFKQKGIAVEAVLDQLERFREGFKSVKLINPALIGDGILRLTDDEKAEFENRFARHTGSITKFVPASGAATRMFKHLFEFRDSYENSNESYERLLSQSDGPVFQFFKTLESFAFYKDLKNSFSELNNPSLEESHLKRDYGVILDSLLSKKGLGYGQLPKGLIKFHQYDAIERTAAEEHLVEGLKTISEGQALHVHFTVSPEFMSTFQETLQAFGDQSRITFSIQSPQTDTIAVNSSNDPFRNSNGELVFRPAGHGALLENLNDLDEEIIFIKNVDNVVHESAEAESILFKKVLGGALLSYQEKIHDLLRRNESGEDVTNEGIQVLKETGCRGDFSKEEVIELLNRPIRVCGMVKNEGEPGGGPFWVADRHGMSLQIIESAQVDKSERDQLEIFKNSTHFNPVDIVCGVKDYKGRKFDLHDFADKELGFISEKSYGGKQLKAMELPGLWNGSMANWNTVFIEVPLSTFNPVKTVNDLLKPNHMPA